MRALVVTGAHFTDSFSLASVEHPSRSVSVFFRVWVPQGREQRFAEIAGVEALKPPPRVDVGWSYGWPESYVDMLVGVMRVCMVLAVAGGAR